MAVGAADGGTLHSWTGRVALVTGGASGIGAACVRQLMADGAKVMVADRATIDAAPWAASPPDSVDSVSVDVRDADAVRGMVDRTLARFGRLDAAINCAGISSGLSVPLAETPWDVWRSVLDTNLDGVFHSMRFELPALLASGGGSIVNISSVMGMVGSERSCAYTAAKHAVVGLTRSAALEYAQQGIRINAVAPGYVDTPMLSPSTRANLDTVSARHPVGRLADAAEIAAVAVFLASSAASFVTGAVYAVDGGYTAR